MARISALDASSSTITGGVITATYAAATPVGATLFAFCMANNPITPPSGWTLISDSTFNASGRNLHMFAKQSLGSETTVPVTVTGATVGRLFVTGFSAIKSGPTLATAMHGEVSLDNQAGATVKSTGFGPYVSTPWTLIGAIGWAAATSAPNAGSAGQTVIYNNDQMCVAEWEGRLDGGGIGIGFDWEWTTSRTHGTTTCYWVRPKTHLLGLGVGS